MTPHSSALVVNGVSSGAVYWPGGIAALVVSGNATAFSLLIVNPDGTTQAFSTATTVAAPGVVAPVYAPAGDYTCTFTGTTTYASLEAVLN